MCQEENSKPVGPVPFPGGVHTKSVGTCHIHISTPPVFKRSGQSPHHHKPTRTSSTKEQSQCSLPQALGTKGGHHQPPAAGRPQKNSAGGERVMCPRAPGSSSGPAESRAHSLQPDLLLSLTTFSVPFSTELLQNKGIKPLLRGLLPF